MKKLFWIFPTWFLIDNVLGLNGYHFTFFGFGIRIILFALSVLSLGIYCLYTVREQKISLWKRDPNRTHILSFVKPIDYFVLGFLVWNFIWATVIPRIKQTNPSMGMDEFEPLLVLVLYFPCAFLLRTGQMRLRSMLKWLIPLLGLLAVWHCVMYIGEVNAPGFYAGYYKLIDIISFGTAVQTDVIVGYGITRIIQVTSTLLIPGMLLLLEFSSSKRRIWPLALLIPMLFAVLITYTKSIWFGILAGLILAVAGILIFSRDAGTKKRAAIFSLAFLVLFCVFNYGFLNNTIITRTLNTTNPTSIEDLDSQVADLQAQLDKIQSGESDPSGSGNNKKPEEIEQMLKDLENQRKDASGSAQANAIRAEQNAALMKKWSQSKLLGFGYGSYAEDCIRSEQFPFMYESLLPSLLMKLGLVGLFGWGVFVMALVVFAVKSLWKKPVRFWCWIGTAIAYAMAVQTNPFLFTFAGFSLMLYLLLFIIAPSEE